MKDSLIDTRFKGNLIFNYGTQAVGVAVGFVTLTLITRHAGIETYGMVAMMVALSGFITNLLTFRTNEAVVAFYKRGQAENDTGSRRLALVAGMTLDLVVGLVLFFLIQFLAPVIADSLLKNSEMATGVAIFSGIVLANFLRGTPLGLLVTGEHFHLINSLMVVEQLLKMILLGLMVWMGEVLTFERIVWATLFPAIGVTLVAYIFPLRKLFGELHSTTIPSGRVADYARFSFSTFLSSSLKACNQNIDTLVLGYFTSTVNVGIYNLIRQFLRPVAMLASPFTAQIYPVFVQAVAEKRLDNIRITIRHADWLLLRGFLAMLAFIAPALVLYGEWNSLNFKGEHYLVFVVIIIDALITQRLWWGRPWSLGIDANISLKANILSSLCVIISLPVLTAFLGGIGCAIGMLFSRLAVNTYYQASFSKLMINKHRII